MATTESVGVPAGALLRPLVVHVPCQVAESLMAGWKAVQGILSLPFDALRAQYANAVRAGLVERSLLGSRDFARGLEVLERLTLGPLARRV